MWKKIKDTQYFLLFSQELCRYEICITDYISVWTTVFSEKAFLAQLKESNEGLELSDDNEFIQRGVQLLSNLDNLKKFRVEKKENGSLFITMTKSFGFPFYLECTLSKGSEELFFQKVTRKLVKIICDLRESQSELRHLLIKKDSEIEEYKCEGGEIVLRHLKTIAFNDAEHMKQHKVYEDNFGASSASTSLLQEAVEILEKNVLKQEPNGNQTPGPSIKAEPVSVIKIEPGHVVKLEPGHVVKMEPDTTATESIPFLKVEPKTEVADETNVPVVTASVSCKLDIKRETSHVPRKRSKFNF